MILGFQDSSSPWSNRNTVHKTASLQRAGTFLLPAGDLARPNNCYLSTDITGRSDESKLLVAKKYFRRRSKGNERGRRELQLHTPLVSREL